MQEISKAFSIKELFMTGKPAIHLTKIISLSLGAILITWLLSQLDFAETIHILRNVPFSLVLLGFVCYAISFFLRAVRFGWLLPRDQQVAHLFPIVLVHYTALNIIPARLGELSYVYLLKKFNHVSMGYSLSSLLIARVFDQIAVSLLFLGSSLIVHLPSDWLKTVNFTVGGGLIAICAALVMILAYKERGLYSLKWLIARFQWERFALVRRAIRMIEEIVAAFQSLKIARNALKILGISLLIWLNIFSVNYLLLKAFAVHLSFLEVLLASTFIILLTVLPIQVTSGFGIHETTWTFIAVAFGVPKQTAIVSAFGTHIVSTLFLLLFAMYGIWKLSSLAPRDAIAPQLDEL